jgi:LmbE family N-acetylglucosaminyl deacetylase
VTHAQLQSIPQTKLKSFLIAVLGVTLTTPLFAQRELSGAAEAKLALDRLNVTASVLMIAAHPDDENTALLAYFARGRKARTGYLSLTRGEGGQNLIGSEQGDELGLIRTEELLAARRIDGAEQFFTRAIDFGFSKTPQETFEKWGHDEVLSDVVWVIRRFRPDVIVLRFSGTPRDGHGQHQVSAIVGKEAFTAAADRTRFPEQLKYVEPWQAKRVVWNVFSFNRDQEREAEKLPNRIEVDPGAYDPVLGHSYGEIAGMSRSMHRSQGMGASERKGSQRNYLTTIAGDPATKDIFDGVETGWQAIPGGAHIGAILAQASHAFDLDHPEKSVPALLDVQTLLAEMNHPVAERKRRELNEAIALCAGLWLDATADKYALIPGGSAKISAVALNRGPLAMELAPASLDEYQPGVAATAVLTENPKEALGHNAPDTIAMTLNVGADRPYSQPYWLREPKHGAMYTLSDQRLVGLAENPPLYQVRFRVRINAHEIELLRPVTYRYIDRVQGELTRPLVIEPAVALQLPERARVFPNGEPKTVEIQVRANVAGVSGEVRVRAPAGWKLSPETKTFQLAEAGEQAVLTFVVTPPTADARGSLDAEASVSGRVIPVGMRLISYPHIPPQTLFPPAQTDVVRANIRTLAKSVGYVMGAGDEVPESLRQLGIDVTFLNAQDLARADLARYDAIVTGVRAFNTRADLRANVQRLFDYVHNGGTMVVQYNVLEGGFFGGDPTLLAHIGPYPLSTGRERVTVEETPVAFPKRESPLLESPNLITARDFEGWEQERGLYFASEWDPRYQPLFETHDPDQKPQLGGTLYAKYGKGVYVFTAFSWFRELPAGVPGAYRIFANLISAGKVL